jgi:hypothetical protein
VQENRHAREPNHEHARMPEALCLYPTRKVRSQPTDEDGHPRTLYNERQSAEDGGGNSLAEKFHKISEVGRRNGVNYGLISGTCINCTSIARPNRQSS